MHENLDALVSHDDVTEDGLVMAVTQDRNAIAFSATTGRLHESDA